MYWDDIFYFSYKIEPEIKVLIINGEDKENFISKALSTESSIEVEELNQKSVNRNTFNDKSLIILNGINDISSGLIADINSFSSMGGSVFIVPGQKANNPNINKLMKMMDLPSFGLIRDINLNANNIVFKDPFFKSIFEKSDESLNLPNYQKVYNCDYKNSSAIPLMFLRDESPVFFKSFKRSFALYSDLSTESSNLVSKSIFPVICLRIAELSKRNNSLYTIIGQSQLIPITNEYKSETPVKIRNKNTEFIPKIIQNGSYEFIDLSGAEAIEKLKPGNYTIEADKTIGSLSLNIDRKESSIDYMSTEGITKALKSKNLKNIEVDQFSKKFDIKKINLNLPQEYWRICIFIVIICIVSEILISKLWKN